ncbi:MAG: penicillin acylase family protein [Myxococcota bacterium]|nr:penicillin acylase family protein [Myxococcota bacterium]
MVEASISYDRHGIPGVWASNIREAYWGIGWIHGHHRPLQSLLLHTAAAGRLSQWIWPTKELEELDASVRRFNIPKVGEEEVSNLSSEGRDWLEGYVDGWQHGFRRKGLPFGLRGLLGRNEGPSLASTVSAVLVSSYLSQALCQERMERAVVDAVREGASVRWMELMFEPHLKNWEPQALHGLGGGASLSGYNPTGRLGGSNAWAIGPSRSIESFPILCGDPHLQVNQVPSLFIEVRVKLPDDFWLGATIPGLPGIGVGRNANLAWSGTNAVADNVDLAILGEQEAKLLPGEGIRTIEIPRRFRGARTKKVLDTPYGISMAMDEPEYPLLVARWSAMKGAASALESYLRLPLAGDVHQGEKALQGIDSMSLHWVLADKGGEIRYYQGGKVPRRDNGFSGLYPKPAGDTSWSGFWEGENTLRFSPEDDLLISANEARLAPDGSNMATLAQPNYRYRRIEALLNQRRDHGFDTMRGIQLDLYSPQAERLRPRFLSILPEGPFKKILAAWDLNYDLESRGAHAFELCRQRILKEVAPELGGDWFLWALAETELPLWWLNGLDELISNDLIWQGSLGERLRRSFTGFELDDVSPWGEVQRVRMEPFGVAGLPPGLSSPFSDYLSVPGSPATICQGSVIRGGGATEGVAPAYRMVASLAEPDLWTTLPGGIDEFGASAKLWLTEWRLGSYHRLGVPDEHERKLNLK